LVAWRYCTNSGLRTVGGVVSRPFRLFVVAKSRVVNFIDLRALGEQITLLGCTIIDATFQSSPDCSNPCGIQPQQQSIVSNFINHPLHLDPIPTASLRKSSSRTSLNFNHVIPAEQSPTSPQTSVRRSNPTNVAHSRHVI